MKWFFICAVVKIVTAAVNNAEQTFSHSSDLNKINKSNENVHLNEFIKNLTAGSSYIANRTRIGTRKHTFVIKHQNNTDAKIRSDVRHYLYNANKIKRGIGNNDTINYSKLHELLRTITPKNRSRKIKYIKIVRYVPVRVELNKDQDDINLEDNNITLPFIDYLDSALSSQKHIAFINNETIEQENEARKRNDIEALFKIFSKNFLRKNDKEESYKLILEKFIIYLQQIGINNKEILKFVQETQGNDITRLKGMSNQRHETKKIGLDSSETNKNEKDDDFESVIPLNNTLKIVNIPKIPNDVDSNIIEINVMPLNGSDVEEIVDLSKEIGRGSNITSLGNDQNFSQRKSHKIDDSNLELNNIESIQVIKSPNKNKKQEKTRIIHQETIPLGIFEVIDERQEPSNNAIKESEQGSIKITNVPYNNRAKPMKLQKSTKGLIQGYNRDLDVNKEKLIQHGKDYINYEDKIEDAKRKYHFGDLDFDDYQEKKESENVVNKYNTPFFQNRNQLTKDTTEKYTNVTLDVVPESHETIRLPYTIDIVQTNNPVIETVGSKINLESEKYYNEEDNIDFDDPASEKPNLTSIFDVEFSKHNSLLPDKVKVVEVIGMKSDFASENPKPKIDETPITNIHAFTEATLMRKILSELFVTLKLIIQELYLYINKLYLLLNKQPKFLKLFEVFGEAVKTFIILTPVKHMLQSFLYIVKEFDLNNFFSEITSQDFKEMNINNDKINEILIDADELLRGTGASKHEIKKIVQESLLTVIRSMAVRREKDCQEKTSMEVKDNLQLALYRNMLAFAVNSQKESEDL